MFKNFNLKSLVAWTGGRMASNKAYYDHKRKHAGPPSKSVLASSEIQNATSSQLTTEFERYVNSGGILCIDDWLKFNLTKKGQKYSQHLLSRQLVGEEIDSSKIESAFQSYNTLMAKFSKLESAFRDKHLSLNYFNELIITSNGIGEFTERYGKVLAFIKLTNDFQLSEITKEFRLKPDRNIDYGQNILIHLKRLKSDSDIAKEIRPDLWQQALSEAMAFARNYPNSFIDIQSWEMRMG